MKLLLLTLLILAGCNSEKPELGAIQGLRDPSNPIPYITSVTTSNTPATYLLGNTVTFDVAFSEIIQVTGTPSIRVQTDGGMFQAYLVSSTSNILTFQYTVAAGQYDLDGINLVMPVLLNGGNIVEPDTGDTVLLTFSSPDLTGFLVNSVTPAITAITPPAAGTYGAGSTLTFTLTYNTIVNVTGAPRFAIDAGGFTYHANYVSGSGTTTHTYSLSSPANRSGAITLIGGTIDYNGGTILDGFAQVADNTFPPTSMAGRNIDTVAPTVSSVSVPANGTYSIGQHLDFSVTFSEPVEIIGANPYLTVTFTSGVVVASYHSISADQRTINFRYTTFNGDADADGIQVSTNLANFNSIYDLYDNNLASGIIAPPSTAGVIVSASVPTMTALTPPAAGTYNAGSNLNFVATFSSNVSVTGTPYLLYLVGGVSSQATYVSGTGTNQLTFRYTVPAGRTGLVSLSGGSILLNSGTIRDAFNTNADLTVATASYAGIVIESVRPTITSVSAPANGVHGSGSPLLFGVTFNEPINNPNASYLVLTLDSGTKNATYNSISGDRRTVYYQYTVANGDNDSGGITLTGVLMSSAAIADDNGNLMTTNTYTLPNTTGVLVDALGPTISNISSSSATQVYSPSTTNTFSIRVNFSETVNISGGVPSVTVDMGGTSVTSNPCDIYSSYIVCQVFTVANVEDTDGINVTDMLLNSATITDTTGNAANLTYGYPKNIPGLKVDTKGPTISSYTYNSAAGTYTAGSLSFNVVFNEAINVGTGSPRIQINLDGTNEYANYLSYSGSSVTFRYVITSTLSFAPVSHSGIIELNGSTIKDLYGNNAELNVPTLDLTRYRIIPGGIGHWFDPNSTYTTTTSAGSPTTYTSLTGSGISSSITGTPTFVTRNGARLLKFDPGDTINLGAISSQIYHVIMVVRAPSVNGDAFSSPANGIGAFWDSNGNVTFGSNCSLGCRYYSSSVSSTVAPFMNATVFTTVDDDYYYLVFESGSYTFTNSNIKIGYNNFSGEIGDVFIFTGNTLTSTIQTKIKAYLDNKYGSGIVYPNP